VCSKDMLVLFKKMFFHPYNFVELPFKVRFLVEMLCVKTSLLDCSCFFMEKLH
jgi:hypothetical protein